MQNKNYILVSIFIFLSLLTSACVSDKQEPIPSVVEEVQEVEEEQAIVEIVDDNITEVIELTPLQKCAKEENKYNIIVNAPENSKIRILNIKPKYKDCIALKKGNYNIEVTKTNYMKYKEWIKVDNDMEIDVVMIELLKNTKIKRKVTEKSLFRDAEYNKKKLQRFIKKYPKSSKVKIAKNRIMIIETKFYNYSPNSLIKYSGCTGFYPKNLIKQVLNISASINYWDNIRWSGSCKSKLMNGRGVLYFETKKGLELALKGKMKNGFFDGKVYSSSNAQEKNYLIKEVTNNHHHKIKLQTKEDFINYQK